MLAVERVIRDGSVAWLMLAGAAVVGCQSRLTVDMDNAAQATFVEVSMPAAIKVQRYTKPLSARDAPGSGSTRSSFQAGRPTNTIEVYLAAMDVFDDPIKATGTYHFELHSQRGAAGGPPGERIALWTVEVDSAAKVAEYWDKYVRAFKFPLQLTQPATLLAGHFILEATYISPWDEKLFDRYEFDYAGAPGSSP